MGPPGGSPRKVAFWLHKTRRKPRPASKKIAGSNHCGPDPDFARVWWRICAVGEVDLMLSFWVVVTW